MHEGGRGRVREGQKERRRGRIPSRLCAMMPDAGTEPDAGLDPINCEIETKSRTLTQLSHPGTRDNIQS